MILQAHSLKKCFNSFCAVDSIDFEIPHGICFGFLGPNGAGKTTTIKMTYGALPPTDGELFLFDLPIQTNLRKIKQRIGVVHQRDILEETISAYDNLKIHGRHFGMTKEAIRQKSEELLSLLQLQTRANDPVYQYSGGMKRRLSIAKGLLNDPEFLLLDEPTTGLDPQARHLLWKVIGEIKKKGVTILLTTHYMHEAEVLCDTLVIMDNGKIIERGTPRELMQKHGRQNLEEVFLQLTGKELRD